MTINEFASIVAEGEGKKKQVNIAQIKEVLRNADVELDGKLYAAIRKEPSRSAGFGSKVK